MAGEIGRGWAALAIAQGWPVTLYDADAELLTTASDGIGDRVRELTDGGADVAVDPVGGALSEAGESPETPQGATGRGAK